MKMKMTRISWLLTLTADVIVQIVFCQITLKHAALNANNVFLCRSLLSAVCCLKAMRRDVMFNYSAYARQRDIRRITLIAKCESWTCFFDVPSRFRCRNTKFADNARNASWSFGDRCYVCRVVASCWAYVCESRTLCTQSASLKVASESVVCLV